MHTNQILLEKVLTPQEYDQIDSFCATHSGVESLQKLAAFLTEQFAVELTLDQDIVIGFTTDSSNLPGSATALCRPRSERECAVIVRACFMAGVPFTVSAGRSNLTGSATPDGGVIISITRMLSPEVVIDEASMTVLSPVGIILEDLRRLVLERSGRKLIFPVNPTSRTDATVGGAIACNASGFTPGEIGFMRSWVESLDFLFPNGLKVRTKRGVYVSADGKFILDDGGHESGFPVPRYRRPAIKNASGPYSSPEGKMDLADLMVGSEGLFGLITACTLKLQWKPSDYLDLFFSLPAEENAVAFCQYLRSRLPDGFGSLSAMEYFGVHCRKYMKHEERLFPVENHQVGIYVQVPLAEKPLEDAAEEWLEILMDANCSIDEDAVMLMDNDRDRAIFLEARHSMPANALEVVQHRGTYTIMTDTVVPPDRFGEFLDYTHGLIQSEGMEYLSFGHLGDNHLHFTILPEKEQLERATEVYDMIIAKSAELGGVYSGEHGTGKRKRADFLRCYGPAAQEEVRRSKAAVDPQFLLNRGNVVEYEGKR